jgi:hypothetical protein
LASQLVDYIVFLVRFSLPTRLRFP